LPAKSAKDAKRSTRLHSFLSASFAGKRSFLALFTAVEQNIAMSEPETTAISRRKCSEIMTKNVRTATADAALRDVASMMRDGDMGAVPVVDGGKLIGIVTDRDIVVRSVAKGSSADAEIREAMTTQLFTVRPDDFVFEAIRLMGDKQVRRVPVVSENGELVGIIAMADVALETEDEREIAETLEEISSGSAFWSKK
jgi:CBS domain-containing protein